MFKQVIDLTVLSLASLGRRIGASLVTVVGTAGVVGILCALFALAAGLTSIVQDTARVDRGALLRTGAQSEIFSYYRGVLTDKIRQIEGIATASGELFIHLQLPYDGTEDVLVLLRSVDADWRRLRPELHITEGRMFERGKNEVIVGRGLVSQYSELAVGGKMPIYNGDLLIVGIFEGNGFDESVLFADIEVLRDGYKRGNAVNITRVGLSPGTSQTDVQLVLDADPEIGGTLVMESDLYDIHIRERKATIETFGYWIVGIMCLGAVSASLSTMHNAVRVRAREIALMRALGFQSLPIISAILIEAMLLSFVGAVIGSALTYFILDGEITATRSGINTTLAYAFTIDKNIVMASICLALAVGLIGGLGAGWRAIKIPPSTAMNRLT